MPYQIVEVKKGGQGYLIENYLFWKDRERDEKIYLKCIEAKRHFCRAREIIEDDGVVLTNENHNHPVPDVVEYWF